MSRAKSNSSPTGPSQPAVFLMFLIGTRVAQSHCHDQNIRNAQSTRDVESIAAGPAAVSSGSCFLARCRRRWEEPIPIALPERQHVWCESQNQGTAGDRDHGAPGDGFLRRDSAPRRSGGVAGRLRRPGVYVQARDPTSTAPRTLAVVGQGLRSPRSVSPATFSVALRLCLLSQVIDFLYGG